MPHRNVAARHLSDHASPARPKHIPIRGRLRITAECVLEESGAADPIPVGAVQTFVEDLPAEALAFLLPSRYCELDVMSQTAWNLFGFIPEGYARVQALCDFVHNHITFNYQNARATRTAVDDAGDRGL